MDAQSLAAIQEFSSKEFRALSTGNIGEGVMVWNKKVVMFDALISKENTLYKSYNTNFHEKAKEQKRLSFEEDDFKTEQTEYGTEENLILQIAQIMDISQADVEQLLKKDTETCRKYLMKLEMDGMLQEVSEGKFRKVG